MNMKNLPFVPNRYRVKLLLSAIKEKWMGLDFSMPDRMYDRRRNDGAMYVVSSYEMLQRLLYYVDTKKYRNFLDVGCGKGYVLWQAKQKGFARVGGIEYDERLMDICRRNMKVLKIEQEVQLACCDACSFADYGSYDVFYFFNPFKEETMQWVMGKILQQCSGKEIMLIYYRPRYASTIESCGCFQRIAELYDEDKAYDAYVYSGRVP